MIAIPYMLSIPALSGFEVSGFPWPAIGVVLAWLVLAAFVGVSLGFLREHASGGPSVGSVERPQPLSRVLPSLPPRTHHDHREAA